MGRLKARGVSVLVERKVAFSEFPEYQAFDPELGGTPSPPFFSYTETPAPRMLSL